MTGSPGADVAIRFGSDLLGTTTLDDDGRADVTVRGPFWMLLWGRLTVAYTADGLYGPWLPVDVTVD